MVKGLPVAEEVFTSSGKIEAAGHSLSLSEEEEALSQGRSLQGYCGSQTGIVVASQWHRGAGGPGAGERAAQQRVLQLLCG